MNVEIEKRNGDQPLIFIVDDSSSERMLLKAALEKDGFATLEVESGEKLFAVLENTRPDLIILDVVMPGMNGFEVCRQLRLNPGFVHLPVLICTGQKDTPSIEKAFDAGATDFITKPFLFHLLPHRVRCLLRSFRAEDKLRDTLARQSAILDSFSGYIYSSSPDYRIEYMNDRLIQKSGKERIGEPCYRVVFGLEEKCPWCVADRIFNGETVRQEIKVADEERWFNVVHTPLSHSDSKISHHALFYDISSRKQAEEGLRESEKKYKELFQQFHTLLNGIPDSIALLNLDKKVVWANESTAKLLGMEGQDLSGKPCEEYWHESSDLCTDCPADKSFVTGKTEEGVKNTADGRIWGIKAFPLKNKAGKVTSVIRLASEITEKIKLREEATRAARLASLGELAAGIAHEINNPNGLILLNIPVLTDAFSDALPILDEYFEEHGEFTFGGLDYSEMREEIPSMHTEVLESAHRIKRIVEDLKDFVRKDSNGHFETVDLNEAVRAAVRLAGNNVKKATDNFVTDFSDDIPMVKGSAQGIEQVAVNLIVNACQALPSKEKGIFVSTQFDAAKNRNILKVRDEGVGISQDKLPHITDPFFTTKREVGGTGLGLSVSARIVKDHGGKLDFFSIPGKGTTVTLSLPLSEEAQIQ